VEEEGRHGRGREPGAWVGGQGRGVGSQGLDRRKKKEGRGKRRKEKERKKREKGKRENEEKKLRKKEKGNRKRKRKEKGFRNLREFLGKLGGRGKGLCGIFRLRVSA
jgi:hypothetical protein